MIIKNSNSLIFWNKIRFFMPGKYNYFDELLKNEKLSRDELDNKNWEKRKGIVSYAYDHVPFYRKKYSQVGMSPQDIKYPEDFLKVPIVNKNELRKYTEEFISNQACSGFMRESTTGGSTGVPLKVFHDNRFHYEPHLWRMMSWWGVSPAENSAFVFRLRRKKYIARLANTIMWWPTKRIQLDASLMTDSDIRDFIKKLHIIQPKLIQGYVASIYDLACFIEQHGMSVPSPKAIWVTSSPLSNVQRFKIESVFGAPVYDQYGCGEVFAIAAQCESKGNLHVFWDSRFIEFVDSYANPVTNGQYGNVLLTDLENRVFPLIRYENGDVGRFTGESCACGRQLPLIDSIKGRTTDTVILPDGSKISGDYLTTIFDDFPEAVQAFQIRQSKDFSIKLLFVASRECIGTVAAVAFAKRELEKRCSGQVLVASQQVEEITNDRGKLRFVISELNT